MSEDGLSEAELKSAHKHSSNHRGEILASRSCGCFYCLATFSPDEIHEWIDNRTTALCPRCHIDSVIGDASGLPITREFLEQMYAYWFRVVDRDDDNPEENSALKN